MGIMSEIGNVLTSNVPINKITSGIAGAIDRRMVSGAGIRKRMNIEANNIAEGEYRRNGKNITLHNGSFRDDVTKMQRLKSLAYNTDGTYNKTGIAGAIAGSYIGVSSAGRIASGGGIYRDSSGNVDLMGVPLI